MKHLRFFIQILSHLSAAALTAGMIMVTFYFSSTKLVLLVPVIALLLFELRAGRSTNSSSLHFSLAVALLFVLFYFSLFGAACPDKAAFLRFALLISAVWLTGRFGFLLGRMTSRKRRAAGK